MNNIDPFDAKTQLMFEMYNNNDSDDQNYETDNNDLISSQDDDIDDKNREAGKRRNTANNRNTIKSQSRKSDSSNLNTPRFSQLPISELIDDKNLFNNNLIVQILDNDTSVQLKKSDQVSLKHVR